MKRTSRKTALALAAILVLAATAAIAAKITVGQCLPASDEVKGWKVIDGTYKECREPNELMDLYNGGWEVYRDAGITRAATQSYKKDKQIVVYIHEFSTADKAAAYYKKEVDAAARRGGGSTKVEVQGGQAAYSVAGPVTTGNLVRGKVHARVNAMGTTDESKQGTAGFLQAIAKKVGQNY